MKRLPKPAATASSRRHLAARSASSLVEGDLQMVVRDGRDGVAFRERLPERRLRLAVRPSD